MRDIYHFGECVVCGEIRALKNGYCPRCTREKPEIPDFLKTIFDNFSKSK